MTDATRDPTDDVLSVLTDAEREDLGSLDDATAGKYRQVEAAKCIRRLARELLDARRDVKVYADAQTKWDEESSELAQQAEARSYARALDDVERMMLRATIRGEDALWCPPSILSALRARVARPDPVPETDYRSAILGHSVPTDRVKYPRPKPEPKPAAKPSMTVSWSDEDSVWIARVAGEPGMAAHGPTPTEALRQLCAAMGEPRPDYRAAILGHPVPIDRVRYPPKPEPAAERCLWTRVQRTGGYYIEYDTACGRRYGVVDASGRCFCGKPIEVAGDSRKGST